MIPHALDRTSQALHAAIVREPLVILPETTVQAAIVLMHRAASQLISSSKSWRESNPWNEQHHAIRAGCMVVVERGQVVGLLTERDVVRLSAHEYSLDNLRVGEVMTRSVMTLRESYLTDPTVAMALLQPPIRHLPVLNEQDALVGIVTLESLSLAIAFQPAPPSQPQREEGRESEKHPQQSLPDDRTLIEQLHQSESKTRALLRAIPDLLLRIGRDGTCYDFIPPVDAKTGTFLPVQQHLSEVLPPDVLQNHLQRVEQALSTGELQIWEHQITKYGVLCDEEVRLVPCGPDECLVMVRDVTERNQAEAALQEREIQYRQIVETALEGIWIIDAESKTSFVNSKMAEMLGYSVSDFLGKSMFDFMDLAEIPVAIRNLERRRQGIAEQHDFKLQHKNGTEVWVLMSTNPLFDESGRYLGALGMVVDISERKQAELALKRSESQSKAILSAIPDLMFQVGRDGVYRGFVTQNRNSDVIPQSIDPHNRAMTELLPPELAERQLRYLHLALETGELQVYEQQLQVKGSLRDEEVRVIKSGDDEVLFMVRDISDRKRSEAERLQAEKTNLELKLLEQILDVVLAGYWDWDIPNQREYLSPGFKRMFGYEDHELLNLPESWQRLIFPEDLPSVLECFDRHIQSRGEIPYYNEVRYHHKDGSIVWVICSGQVIEWDAVGNPLRMIGCHINISDRKQAEIALQESQRFIQQIADASPNILYVYDLLEEQNVYVNREIGMILGYTPAEIQAMGPNLFATLLHPKDWQKLPGRLERINTAQDGEILELEYRMRHANGSWRWLHSWDTIFCRDEKGQPKQIIGTAQDITERKQAEAQLQQVSERLALALKSGEFGCWEWDMLQNTILWDERMCELYGIPKQENSHIVYETWTNALHPDDREKTETLIQQATLGKAEYDTEFRVVHPDGSVHFIKAYGVVVWDAHGLPQRMIGVNFDISKRKQAEIQLQQTNEELARATRLKDEFLANMSHELRTPLNAVLGMTEGLLEGIFGNLNERQIKALKTVSRSGSHLLDLINDILDMAKIESGQIRLDRAATAMIPLCQDSLAFVTQQALKKNLQIKTHFAPDLPAIWVDERRIRQVLINLLSNAVKFTPEGGCITLQATCSGNGFLRIAVTDTGIGIAPHYIKQLFKPFMQVDSALNRQYQGTGLGLALVKHLVELHGGQVSLTSEVGVGSCFTVDLPCSQSSQLQ